MKYKYIAIEGNIGSGKTTLATSLSESLGYKLVLEEFEDNSYLPKFYEDPERNAFPLELSFLAERYKQLRNIDFKTAVISDYIFDKSWIFASNNLPEAELKIYKKVYKILHSLLPKPDLIILLECNPENLLHRIQERGRDYEMNIRQSYLDIIDRRYGHYFSKKRFLNKVIRINTFSTNINQESEYNKLIDLIREKKD